MERRAGFWIAVGLGVLAIIVSAVLVVNAVRTDDQGPVEGDVLIIGDSVTFMSADPIKSKVGTEGLQIMATPGHRSTDLLPILQSAVDARGGPESDGLEKAAFLVGYNDVLDDVIEENVLAEMVELSSHFDCAVWLALPGGFGDATDEILRTEVDRYDTVHLDSGWAEAVEADRSLLKEDGVHPTGKGTDKLGDIYHSALHEWCDPAPIL